jgi:phosphoserine aminotransferase
MSSEFCSTSVDWSKYAMVYAGAQKNVGPAGVTMVIVRDDCLNKPRADTPKVMNWTTIDKAMNHFDNTPCCWSIYLCGLNLAYMREKGLAAINAEAKAKSGALYNYIDSSDFYSNNVE